MVFRPIGGRLADRVHPAVVTAWALGVVAALAVVQAFDPSLTPGATICLLVMAAGLGTASGSVFALVARVAPQPQVGGVTGIVGAMGGLGGFVPPLVTGAVYSAKNSYSIGFMLLSALALAGCVYAYGRMRTAGRDAGGGLPGGRDAEGPRLRGSARRPPGPAGQNRAAAQDDSSDFAAASRDADGAVAPLVISA